MNFQDDEQVEYIGSNSSDGRALDLWQMFGIAWARRRLILIVTVAVIFVSVVIALLLPRDFAAEARVMQPETSPMGGLAALAGGALGGGLSSLLGGGSTEYTRYLAILHSRSFREDVIDRFDLTNHYGLSRRKHPHLATLKRLDKALEFEIDAEYGFMIVRSFDRDPEQSAEMSNYIVDRLNLEHARLTSENARQSREYLENRIAQARGDLDSVQVALQTFQEEHGVIELTSQAEAFLHGVAETRANMAQLEVQYLTMAQQYGPDNPNVAALRSALAAARSQQARAFSGGEELLPIALRDMPAAGREYTSLIQEQMIQAQILESVYPLYEHSAFQERLEADAVQILDHAVTPVLPARPSRRLIVLISAFSAFTLMVVFVVADHWVRSNRALLARRMRQPPDVHTV